MNVCHVMNTAGIGGAESFTLELIRNTDQDEVSFTLCYLGSEHSRVDEFRAAGARVISLDSRTDPPQLDPSVIPKFLAVARRESFDVLHAHMPFPQVLARLAACTLTNAAVVSTQHTRRQTLPTVSRLLVSATAPLDERSVAVSDGVRRSFTRPSAGEPDADGRWTTIYNGIDVESFYRKVADAALPDELDGSGPVFLNVGRYVPEKGQKYLIDAMARVRDELPGATAVLVGFGPLRDELKARVADRGLEDAVQVAGRSSTVERYYAVADAFVFSSVAEGLPVTGLEAMAAALPVVGTRIPGVDEIVDDGVTGILAPPRAPDALADAMLALGSEQTRTRMGRRGLERVRERFAIERSVDAYLDLYRSVVPGASAAAVASQ